jgi:hypothetical protein
MRITFRLKDDRDEDLLRWFNALGEGERSFFIRQALRRGLGSQGRESKHPCHQRGNAQAAQGRSGYCRRGRKQISKFNQ